MGQVMEQEKQQTTKELYCICYERLYRNRRGDVVKVIPKTEYLHANDREEARLQFMQAAPRTFQLGRDYRIVASARALGAFYEKGTEDKLNAIAEIE